MLRIDGLVAGYRDSRVLDRLDLAIAPGGLVALLGRNGMGKTTLLRALMGLLPVAHGRINFAGHDIVGRRPFEISNLGMAYVPQGREIFADLSVAENLLLGVIGKPGGPEVPEIVFDYLPILAERRDQKAGTLSGGQQQQLAIARALAGRPRMVLLDEPSEGIQPSIVEEIAVTLKRAARAEGLTVLLVEQNIEMALETAQTCALIENGRIVARHDCAGLRADPAPLHRHLAV